MLQRLTKNPKDRFLPSDCYMRSRIKHAIKTMENRKEMPLNHGMIMRDLLLKFYQANGNPSMSDVIWATDLEEGRPLVFEYDGGVEENDVVELYCWLYDSNRLCNMNSLKNTNPRSFIIQNHNKGDLRCFHNHLEDPVLRRYYLSFVSLGAREEIVQRREMLRNTVKTCDNRTWTAPTTPWERDLTLYFNLYNRFVEYDNIRMDAQEEENFQVATPGTMRKDWMPYRSSEYCEELWYRYRGMEWHYIYKDMEDGGRPKFYSDTNMTEKFHWVEMVLLNVEWMENDLPSCLRIVRDLVEY